MRLWPVLLEVFTLGTLPLSCPKNTLIYFDERKNPSFTGNLFSAYFFLSVGCRIKEKLSSILPTEVKQGNIK